MDYEVTLNDLNYDLWRSVIDLYRSDPYAHSYLVYDMLYYLNRINVVFKVSRKGIESYALYWRGYGRDSIHLWGPDIKPIKRLIDVLGGDVVIQLYDDSVVDDLIDYLRSRGFNVRLEYYLDMVVDEDSFKPYSPDKAIRLSDNNLTDFLELERIAGRIISEDVAREILTRWRYYGLYVNGTLVSIACRYLALPEVHIIGDVFTHPNFRGRGYAKIVTSAVTRDAVLSGAHALLHVREGNDPAIRVYRALGYRVLRRRAWVIAKKLFKQ
ncbi:MAG: hypothetical protein DRO18_02080 [Thermoprotei archaeon]|nr:MAG: hypothetical protein DRO18_02080 [Thermoprotei archaeon]